MVRRWRKRIKSKIKYTREHILYFGYGMNTNLEQMAGRCPGSKSLGHATLYNHEFSFRTFADVYPRQGSKVEGVLWKITPDNLKALDALEGYPFMYDRKRVPVVHKGKVVWALTYYMVSLSRWGAPSDGYVKMLRDGYKAHNVPHDQIDIALKEHKQYEYDELAYYESHFRSI